ncbi:flagellar hook-associated protein FlgK [bacterium]|nr:flagellar hook-associated protein FlgK [bacterium]
MPTINSTLSMAKRALMANQGAISVASDNVSNVNTPGYARKRALMASIPGLETELGVFGGGVSLLGISGERDVFIERQVRYAMGESGQHETCYQQLKMIEDIVGDMGETGLESAMDRFWNSWHDLANDPTSMSARNALSESTNYLTNRFHNIDEQLNNRTANINGEIENRTERVNTIIKELSNINKELSRANGDSPSAIDRRTVLLDELSELTGAEYKINDNETTNVYLNGISLLIGADIHVLKAEKDADGNVSVIIPAADNLELNINAGKIGALFDVRDNDLSDLRVSLDEFAATLVKEVNDIHISGYNVDGATGICFFDPETTGIHNISLSDEILADVNNIAASGDGNAGDNQIALLIAGLDNKVVLNNGANTFTQAFSNILSEIGSRVVYAETVAEGAQLTLQQAEVWRESVSGVSLDEEMAELVRYQNSFNASAKLVTTVESMLDTVIAMAK